MEHLLKTQGWFLSVVYTHRSMLKWSNLFIHDAKNSIIIYCQWKGLLNSMKVSSRLKYIPSKFQPYKICKKSIWEVKILYCRCSKWNHKVSFQHLKQIIISNITSNNTNSANLRSTNLENFIIANHEFNSPIIYNLNSFNSQNPISYSNAEKFYFVLVGIPMDGIFWKEIILSTSTHF